MSDIVRMLRVSESDPVQQEAAAEIERLRAELAAEKGRADKAIRMLRTAVCRLDYLSEDDCATKENIRELIDAMDDTLDEITKVVIVVRAENTDE